jgi:hypothetical protein
MKNKEIREILMNNEVVFTVKGITEYGKNEEDTWCQIPKRFKTRSYKEEGVTSIYEELGWHGMNINKFGPTCVTLYTFDILGKKSVGKIKYEDVTIIEE